MIIQASSILLFAFVGVVICDSQPIDVCDVVECKDGFHCKIREDCESCSPCVADKAETCDLIRCPKGKQCENVQVSCIREPCPPVPRCVAIRSGNQTCGENEVYTECGSACPQKCPGFGDDRVCTLQCVPGCQCKAGFLRDVEKGDGKCVPLYTICPIIEPSPLPPMVVSCANIRCTEEGTICQEVDGIPKCVKDELPHGNQTCGENEVYTECGSACPQKCPGFEDDRVCTLQCVPGCQCKAGFLRDVEKGDGKCVPLYTICPIIEPSPLPPMVVSCANIRCTEEGTICQEVDGIPKCVKDELPHGNQTCGEDEEYTECGSACPRKCPMFYLPPFGGDDARVCTLQCVPGCQCKEGYVRAGEKGDGKCMREIQCPPIEPTPEPINCANVRCPAETTCHLIRGSPICTPDETPGNNTCSNINEVFTTCGTACEPTCFEQEPICTQQCVVGCQCKDGFVRNENGLCVPKELCGDVKPPSPGCEVVRCSAGHTCHVVNGRAQCVPDGLPGNITCSNINEVFTTCGTACEPTCAEQERICTKECVVGCQCKDGFVRNENGLCVPKELCGDVKPPSPGCEVVRCSAGHTCQVVNGRAQCVPDGLPGNITCSNINEVFNTCGSACEPTCAEQERICTKQCVVGCQCKAGFVRNENGLCVPKELCGDVKPNQGNTCSGLNEEYRECGAACEPKCSDDPFHVILCATVCLPGACHCKVGYVRDGNNLCVPKELCPDQTEIICERPVCNGYLCYMEGIDCDAVVDPPTCEKIDCRYGHKCYMEAGQPRCRPDTVPGNNTCSNVNEVFSVCGTACEPTCSEQERMCAQQCVVGCQCVPGFVRNQNGLCVPKELCGDPAQNSPCRGLNEEFNQCGTACPATCADDPANPKPCTKQCVAECQCKDGHVRNENNQCVPRELCPDANAPTCDTVDCRDGHRCYMQEVQCVRAPCPKQPMCLPIDIGGECSGLNEVYDECGKPESCDEICGDDPLKQRICPTICITRCRCKDGYVKSYNGKCIPKELCPLIYIEPTNCTRDNEVYKECGTRCEPACSDDPNEPKMCTLDCVKGCQCSDGFVRDNNGACILKETCPVVPEECPNNDAEIEEIPTCSQIRCPSRQKCELKEVTCVRAPCYPVPDCVPE